MPSSTGASARSRADGRAGAAAPIRCGAVIVVAGEALIDLVIRPDGSVTAALGGGPFNVARTIARLGGDAAFLGAISDDRFGSR